MSLDCIHCKKSISVYCRKCALSLDCIHCEKSIAVYCGKCVLAELDEERANVETLKLHVETLREAAQNAANEVMRLRAERDALAGEASSIEQNVGALLDLYHARMIESEHQAKARTAAVNAMLSANGCDCECDHACKEDHEKDCERCLACRIDAALNQENPTP